MNGQAALKFNGINDALKYASTQLPNEDSGDVFIVAQFAGGGDNLEVDTLFPRHRTQRPSITSSSPRTIQHDPDPARRGRNGAGTITLPR